MKNLPSYPSYLIELSTRRVIGESWTIVHIGEVSSFTDKSMSGTLHSAQVGDMRKVEMSPKCKSCDVGDSSTWGYMRECWVDLFWKLPYCSRSLNSQTVPWTSQFALSFIVLSIR